MADLPTPKPPLPRRVDISSELSQTELTRMYDAIVQIRKDVNDIINHLDIPPVTDPESGE